MLLNKLLIVFIVVSGILLGNVWIAISVIPSLLVNLIVYILIKHYRNEYPLIVRKKLLRQDVDYLDENIYMNILVISSKLLLAGSFGYIAYIISIKLFGIIQLWSLLNLYFYF